MKGVPPPYLAPRKVTRYKNIVTFVCSVLRVYRSNPFDHYRLFNRENPYKRISCSNNHTRSIIWCTKIMLFHARLYFHAFFRARLKLSFRIVSSVLHLITQNFNYAVYYSHIVLTSQYNCTHLRLNGFGQVLIDTIT